MARKKSQATIELIDYVKTNNFRETLSKGGLSSDAIQKAVDALQKYYNF